ncbi:MAG: DUF3108 domain-containing protein [Deltaproteobacteria bacterium]|nr:DUF3108 domain-containing protein [Deltaproteobacteria bacterium]
MKYACCNCKNESLPGRDVTAARLSAWALILCVFLWIPPIHAHNPEDKPFSPGEKLVFIVTWSSMPVGQSVLEVMPNTSVNGLEAQHFVMTARTNSFADIFYKVRDRMEGFTDKGMTRSLMYRKSGKGKSRRNVVVAFDWEARMARYFNNGEKHASVKIMPGSFDPLSVFFAFRFSDLEISKEIAIPVSDGKKTVTGRAIVLEREVIDVQGHYYDTFLVQVDMNDVDGVFKKSKDASLYIWVTADDRRIPVRIKSSVIVGSFNADLLSAELSNK